jgi:hypothetical protein
MWSIQGLWNQEEENQKGKIEGKSWLNKELCKNKEGRTCRAQ